MDEKWPQDDDQDDPAQGNDWPDDDSDSAEPRSLSPEEQAEIAKAKASVLKAAMSRLQRASEEGRVSNGQDCELVDKTGTKWRIVGGELNSTGDQPQRLGIFISSRDPSTRVDPTEPLSSNPLMREANRIRGFNASPDTHVSVDSISYDIVSDDSNGNNTDVNKEVKFQVTGDTEFVAPPVNGSLEDVEQLRQLASEVSLLQYPKA